MWRLGRTLEQQVQLLDGFFNMAPDLLCIVNFEGAFTKVNPSFTRALGYTQEELFATSLLSFVHPFDLPDVEAKFATMLVQRKPQYFEARFLCKDESVRILAWSTNTDHELRQISCAARDVTEARRMERDLLQTMSAIHSSAIVAVTNVTGQITEVNDNFCKISGYSRAELIGQTHDMLDSGSLSAGSKEAIRRTLMAGNVWSGELNNRAKNGSVYTAHAVITPILGLDGQVERLFSIRFDRTQEKRMKEDLQIERSKTVQSTKMATLGELASGIAHEINNPLSVIMLTCGMLPGLAANPELLESKANIIEKACDRVAKIVSGLRKYSRIADRTAYGEFALSYLVRESLSLTESKARRHAVDIELLIDSEAKLFCNEIEIEQVLVNLVNNAIDAIKGKDQPRWIQIHIAQDEHDLILRVRDCGERIHEDIANKLFQPFFTTKAVGEGTGLGLSIVKNILDSHGAGIALSPNDENTCFEIRFAKPSGDNHVQ